MLNVRPFVAMLVASVALFGELGAAVDDRSALRSTRKLQGVADTCGHQTVCSRDGQLSCQQVHPQCTIHNHYGEGSCCCCPSEALPSPSPPISPPASPPSPPMPSPPMPSPPMPSPPMPSPPMPTPPVPVPSPPSPIPSCATAADIYVINFMGGRGAPDTNCRAGICGGQDYACTNGTGMPRASFTDRGNPMTQTVVDIRATVQRASTAPAELVFYLNNRREGTIPPAAGTTLQCGSTLQQCTIQQLEVPNPGSYNVGGLNNVRLDDDMGQVTCYPMLVLTVTYQLNSCMNTPPPPTPTPPAPTPPAPAGNAA